jgi:hypothetical protein
MLALGQAVLAFVLFAAYVEHVRDKGCGRPVGVVRWEGELGAIIERETWDRVHAILRESPRKLAARIDITKLGPVLEDIHERLTATSIATATMNQRGSGQDRGARRNGAAGRRKAPHERCRGEGS